MFLVYIHAGIFRLSISILEPFSRVIGDIIKKCLYATHYVNILLGFTSGGPSTGQPVYIPLHDSELVYVVEQLPQAAFRNLATSLQISDADVNLIPSGDTPHAQEMRTALLFSWRDSQKDILNARTSLAQSLAD